MGDTLRNWLIRRNGIVEGPFTEYELRRKIVGSDLNGCQVKQGRSEWFPAKTVLKKFKELARAGIYLRFADHVEGPFTAARTLQMLRETTAKNCEARVGLDGTWVPGENFLAQLERLAKSRANRVAPIAVNGVSPNHSLPTSTPLQELSKQPISKAMRFTYPDQDSDDEFFDYPRLPNQQRPIMYVMPGAFIALWGVAAFGYTTMSLYSGGLGIATAATWFFPNEVVVGTAPRVIFNVVLMILIAMMILGSVSMILRRNLTLARASAVLATIPFVGCVAMPFGLWACVVLFTRDAARDFS